MNDSRPQTRTTTLEPLDIEKLVVRHYDAVYYFALSILNDAAAADDAAQETFIKASEQLGRFRGDSTVKTWLFSIALNQCRGQMRKNKARQRMRQAWDGVQSLFGRGGAQPEEMAQRNQAQAKLWSAVDKLNEKHKMPVIMYYLHEMSAPEIAAVLDISEGTVHSRLYHARDKLQGILRLEGVLGESR